MKQKFKFSLDYKSPGDPNGKYVSFDSDPVYMTSEEAETTSKNLVAAIGHAGFKCLVTTYNLTLLKGLENKHQA